MQFLKSLFEPSSKSIVKQVRKYEDKWRDLTDEELRKKTDEFRERIDKGEDLFHLIPEAFACVVLASERTLKMRHFDVQIQGGVELARGQIVEMKTGEGKTLVATLPAYLHGITGKGVHVVTVNDYLAARDAEWMGEIYNFLGLTVGCVQEDMGSNRDEEILRRREAYSRDITYVTNAELVFDFLRDNLAFDPSEIVQRGCYFAIVDEVDLLLVDEAQTPLIISGPGHEDTTIIRKVNQAIRKLAPDKHYKADHRTRSAFLTEIGLSKLEDMLKIGSLSEAKNIAWAHSVHQSLQAYGIFEKDVDYIVAGDEIHIVDEHTGRVSPEKRYSNGLHQAIEAKENVKVRSEDLTLAKTSYQYFFRGYTGICGMTGTAYSEREEFRKIYQLKVVRIPTHKPMVRKDFNRIVYLTLEEKFSAIVEEIKDAQKEGRPVLVGTVSVDESEVLSRLLKRSKIPHQVLNARQHDKEAFVVAQAGREKAVTISTNMAGRGTDIMLGGNPKYLAEEELLQASQKRKKNKKTKRSKGGPYREKKVDQEEQNLDEIFQRLSKQCEEERERVVEAGGLLVIGTGEHESVRIDNQLRGRSGRQGDPGESVYLVSLEDPVYRRFGQKKVLPLLFDELNEHPEGEPIEDSGVFHALDGLRKKVEIENQAARLDVFKYDSVIHERRESIWKWRRELLSTQDKQGWKKSVRKLIDDLLVRLEEEATREIESQETHEGAPNIRERWRSILRKIFLLFPEEELEDKIIVEPSQASDFLFAKYQSRLGTEADDALIEWERLILLQIIDVLWPQYLNDLERVEEGIWMRSYAQVDPFVEFRKECAFMYGQLMKDIELDALRAWLAVYPDQELELSDERARVNPSQRIRRKS